MAEFKTATEFETKDVVDEKIKDLDTKFQKKLKSSTKDIEKEVNKQGKNIIKVQETINKQIEASNQKLCAYIKKEKSVEFLKNFCKDFLKFDYVEMSSNDMVKCELNKIIIKTFIKDLKNYLKFYKTLNYDEFKPYIQELNPNSCDKLTRVANALDTIEAYNKTYGEK